VEILARYLSMSSENPKQAMNGKIIECPLESWTGVSGSKLRIKDFFGISLGLARIWFRYHKQLAGMRQSDDKD
jgi:hypothetical protein